MKIVDCGPQRSESWLQWRKGRVTASDVSAIMGKSPWTTAEDVFFEKLGLGKERVVNAAMQHGIDNESTALAMLSERVGVEFKPMVVEHDTLPLGASLDGGYFPMEGVLYINPSNQQLDDLIDVLCTGSKLPSYIAEVKCTSEKSHSIVKHGIVPDHYLLQVQCQLLCSGADLCFFANYCDGDLAIIEVRPDPAMQAEIIEATQEFWRRVQELDPPEPKYVEREDSDWWIAVCALNEIQSQLKTLQDDEAQAKARLVELSAGKSTKGHGMAVIHSVRAGSVDYAKICAENNIDTAQYRKPATPIITVRKVK